MIKKKILIIGGISFLVIASLFFLIRAEEVTMSDLNIFNKEGTTSSGLSEIGTIDKDKITTIYTPYSKTTCSNGICNQIIESRQKYIYEDNQWKDVEDARSLKGSDYIINELSEDKDLDVNIINYNMTSITVAIGLNEESKEINKDIPIRMWDLNETKEDEFNQKVEDKIITDLPLNEKYKETYDKVSETTVNFKDIENYQIKTYEFGFSKVLELGYNSTELVLEYGSSTADLFVDTATSPYEAGVYSKWDISSIPANVIIDNAIWCSELNAKAGTVDNDVRVWRFNDQTWSEASTVSTFGTTGDYDNVASTTISTTTVGQKACINVSQVVQIDYEESNSYSTIHLEDPDHLMDITDLDIVYDSGDSGTPGLIMGDEASGGNYLSFCDREGIAGCSPRPSLNITYSEPTYTLNISSPTTSSPESVSSYDNITVRFDFIQDGTTNITTGVTLNNITIGGVQAPVKQSEGGGSSTAYPIFYDGFEAGEGWYYDASGACSNSDPCDSYGIDGWTNCNDASNDYEWCASSDNSAPDGAYSGTYGLLIQDIDNPTAESEDGLWYNFDASTACDGGECEAINVTFYGKTELYSATGDCWVTEQVDDGTPIVLSNVDESAVSWTLFKSSLSSGALLSSNVNVRIVCNAGAASDYITFDDFNITGYSSEGINEFAYTDGIGWTANVTVPNFAEGLKDLFVNASYSSNSQTDTETEAINYGSATPTYATFGNIWDDNNTIIQNGTGHFFANVFDTNGTVFLEINNSNNTASLTTNPPVTSYSYLGKNISTTSPRAEGLYISPDGTKMYELDATDSIVFQHNCSDAWNISSCVYEDVNITTSAQDLTQQGIFFKSDGTQFYTVGVENGRAYQYNCSMAWNLSSCGYGDAFVSTTDSEPSGIYFKPDGTKMYVSGYGNDLIYQYTCSNSWQLASCSYDNLNLTTQDNVAEDLFISLDGTKIYEIGSSNTKIYEYFCSDAWNISSCKYNGINITTQDTLPLALSIHPNKTSLYEVGGILDKIYESSGVGEYYNTTAYLSNPGTYEYRWYAYGDGVVQGLNYSDIHYYYVQEQVTDSCTYSSGNWIVDCSDNCIIDSNVDLGGNDIILTGTGIFRIEAIIHDFNKLVKSDGCRIEQILGSGGKLIK